MSPTQIELQLRQPPLEVLFVVGESFFARLGLVVRHLATAMIDSAARVTVACSAARLSDDFFGPVRLVRYSAGGIRARFGGFRRLRQAVAEHPPDVVFAFGSGRRAGRELTRAFGCPVVHVASSSAELKDTLSTASESRLPLVVLSTPLLEQALESGAVPPEHVRLVRPGLHFPEIKAPQPPETGEEAPGEPAQTILMETPLTGDCGVSLVLDAVRRIPKEERNLMVFLVGAGPAERQLRRQCDRLGLRGKVTFAGELAIGRVELAGFDVFIQPRAEDEMSLEVIQALGAGVAVISAGAGNHDCLVEDETALFYSASSSASLAKQIERLLVDRSFTQALAARGAQYVRKQHQVSAMAEAYTSLQRELLGRG